MRMTCPLRTLHDTLLSSGAHFSPLFTHLLMEIDDPEDANEEQGETNPGAEDGEDPEIHGVGAIFIMMARNSK